MRRAHAKNGPFMMFGNSALHFLRAELQTGMTMSRIAHNANGEAKKRRTLSNARKAYDSIVRFLPEARLSPDEAFEVKTKLAELREDLRLLGEKL